MDPLKKIAEETEEDYQTLEKILKDAGVKTYRSFLDINKYVNVDTIQHFLYRDFPDDLNKKNDKPRK